MIDGKALLIALMALCGANFVMIWQISTLADRVHEVHEDMHAAARRLARMEAYGPESPEGGKTGEMTMETSDGIGDGPRGRR